MLPSPYKIFRVKYSSIVLNFHKNKKIVRENLIRKVDFDHYLILNLLLIYVFSSIKFSFLNGAVFLSLFFILMFIYIYKSLERIFYLIVLFFFLALLYKFLFSIDYNNIQYFLSAGYDNFGHFGTYFASSQNGLALYADKNEAINFPKSIYSFYPPGFYAIFSYLNNLIVYPTNIKISIINFLFFNIFLTLILIFSLMRIVLSNNLVKSKLAEFIVRAALMSFFTIYIYLGNFSHMVVSGYPTYFLGLVILLSILHVHLKPNSFFNYVIIIFGTFLLYKTMPILLLLLSSLFYILIKNLIQQINLYPKLWYVLIIISLPLLYYILQTNFLYFNKFILNSGGVESFPNFYFALLCLIAFPLCAYKFGLQSYMDKRLSMFSMWMIFSTSFLILYSIAMTNEIRYYIVKQMYFVSIILITIILNKIVRLSTISIKNNLSRLNLVAVPMMGLLFFSFDLGLNPSVYKGSAMGAFPTTFNNIWIEKNYIDLPFNPHDLSLAAEYLKNRKTKYSVFVSYNGGIDLPSRWLSIYSNQFNDDTWAVYYNLFNTVDISKNINDDNNEYGVIFDLYDRINLDDRKNLSSLGWRIITSLSELNE
jgi:hypothetical protein